MHEEKGLQRAGWVDELAEALDRRRVEYCHWKSNWALADSLSGEGDLDLFVDRRSLPDALAVLASLGFKPAVTGRGPETQGATHHYGLDPQSCKLLHVHLYTMLLTGESYVKSHRLPFETMLLENRSRIGPLTVVSKPAELVLHVLRTFVKYGALADVMGLRRKPESVAQELAWLQMGTDTSDALSLLKRHCPAVDAALFLRCIDALNGHASLPRRMTLARAIRRRLRMYATHTRRGRLLAYSQLFWTQCRVRLARVGKNRNLQSGGAVIAFVGGDGVGKSTLVLETSRWLARAFAVRTLHAGKPPVSWLTAPARIAWGLIQPLLARRRGAPGTGRTPGQPSLLRAIQATLLAWDRCRLLIRARRHAANGDIVICDRYPSDAIGAMDSPRLREEPGREGWRAALHNWLARAEHRLYAKIPPPDVVVRLAVSLETARQRNRNRAEPDAHDYLEARHRGSGAWNKLGTLYAYDIDTEGPLEETVLRVKKAVWQSL